MSGRTITESMALAGLLLAFSVPALAAGTVDRVVLLSIDGLMPSTFAVPGDPTLVIPNLRRLAAEGARADGVVGVLPSVTYPSHTTILSGVPPRVHGVVSNKAFDPTGVGNEAWLWYASRIRVPTLIEAARARRLAVGSVSWPVSVGASADYLVPEFWRSGSSHPDDLELLRALSTPRLIDEAGAARGRPFSYPPTDADRMDLALHILRAHRPELLLVHLFEVDSAEHDHGPGTPAARAAIEASDRELGRLLATLDELGLAERTLVAIVSDHGFLPVEKILLPNAWLAEAGLVERDEKGSVRSWRAWFQVDAGSAALHLADPGDHETERRVRELVAARAAAPGSGIHQVLDRHRIESLGGDADAVLWLDAAAGFAFSSALEPAPGPPDPGTHGHSPDRPELHASLILWSPSTIPSQSLGLVPMTRIAATLARALGLDLPVAAPALELAPNDPLPARAETGRHGSPARRRRSRDSPAIPCGNAKVGTVPEK